MFAVYVKGSDGDQYYVTAVLPSGEMRYSALTAIYKPWVFRGIEEARAARHASAEVSRLPAFIWKMGTAPDETVD